LADNPKNPSAFRAEGRNWRDIWVIRRVVKCSVPEY